MLPALWLNSPGIPHSRIQALRLRPLDCFLLPSHSRGWAVADVQVRVKACLGETVLQ